MFVRIDEEIYLGQLTHDVHTYIPFPIYPTHRYIQSRVSPRVHEKKGRTQPTVYHSYVFCQ